jgi:hypothetical protein
MADTQKVIRVGGIAVECFSPEEESTRLIEGWLVE